MPLPIHSSNCSSDTLRSADALDLKAARALSASDTAIFAVSCSTRETASLWSSRLLRVRAAMTFGVARKNAIRTALP